MKRTEHTFTRSGEVYDCVAKADTFAGPSGFRRKPVVIGRTWWAAVEGREYSTVRWTGVEFASTEARIAFEDSVVAMVSRQTPLRQETVALALDNKAATVVKRPAAFQRTVCPLCRSGSGVTRSASVPRVTEIRCRRCGDFHIDDVWMAWADSSVSETIEERDAFARQSCEANASGLLLQLTEEARGLPFTARMPKHQHRTIL